jgi:CheY-like chemotaxis protein/anti-sigma regulatory factor (Ser/Thr protein kinase)
MGELPDCECLPETTEPSATILVLTAQDAERRLVQKTIREKTAWQVSFVGTHKDALSRLGTQIPSVLLMDLQDVGGHGVEFIDTVRRKHPLVPIVILIRRDDEPVFHALRHGAVNYVPWRLIEEELVEILESVLMAAEVRRCKSRLLGHLRHHELHFVLGNDTSLIPPLITLFQDSLLGIGICESTESIRVSMALEEALVNAVYHGNLEVSSQLRNDPDRGDQRYREEIEHRRKLAPYRDRTVSVRALFEPRYATFVVLDQGPGFDPGALPDPTDPDNIELASGRGLLLIRTFMDEVRHNAKGNEITMVKRKHPR